LVFTAKKKGENAETVERRGVTSSISSGKKISSSKMKRFIDHPSFEKKVQKGE
jgi:hypothetical protein